MLNLSFLAGRLVASSRYPRIDAEGLRVEFFREEDAGDLARVLARFMAAAGEQERQRQVCVCLVSA